MLGRDFRVSVKGLSALALLVGVVLLGQNCSDVKLQRVPSNSTTLSTKFCLQPPEKKKRYSKIAFMVDKSGSNGSTDPNKTRRANAIRTFVDQYRNDPYYKWAFMMFQADAAVPYIRNGDVPVYGTPQDVDQALIQFNSDADTGGTPYGVALDLLKLLIKNDMQEHPEEDAVYNIFFISDGRPTPGSSDGCDTADCTPILNSVADLVSLDRSSVFLNTVYYYATNPDVPAQIGLEKMAEVGGGTFANAGNGEPIIFTPVRTGERPEPWVMKGSKVIAYNMTSAFCRDGGVGSDSDADGICDDDEIFYNSVYGERIKELYPGKQFDPLNRNSFHVDYSDSFVWKFDLTSTGAGLPPCKNNRPDKDFDLLNYCEELLLKDTKNANGPDMVWDSELMQSGGAADPDNFDSDGDLFLDFLEFFTFRLENAISGAVDYASKDTKIRGVTLEQIMYEHRHFMRADDEKAAGRYLIRTSPEGISEESGQQCYGFSFDKIPTYLTKAVSLDRVGNLQQLVHEADENLYLIYFIATPEDQRQGKGILYHQVKKIPYGYSSGISLKIEDFESYKVPRKTGMANR